MSRSYVKWFMFCNLSWYWREIAHCDEDDDSDKDDNNDNDYNDDDDDDEDDDDDDDDYTVMILW